MKHKDVVLYKILRPIINILFKVLYNPKYIGLDNIPTSGSVILAGNHTSIMDCIYLISSTKRNIHFLAKEELWHGVKKILFANMGLIPVYRNNHDHQALVDAEEYLKNNLVIGIFPEGTTEKVKGKIMPFKVGAVKMASDVNTKIIPFIIKGDYKIFSRNLQIKFLKPITIKDNIKVENERLYNIIKDEMEDN